MDAKERIDSVFGLLDTWRNLPAYQLERRADIFFAIYLSKIIKDRFGKEINCLIPEFPVRVGHVIEKNDCVTPNRSFKIDYVVVAEEADTVFLIELKTDASSRRDKQDWYLRRAKEINIPGLTEGILEICKATVSLKKYDNLISLLGSAGWVDSQTRENTARPYNIEIVYIQPKESGENNVISFDRIIECLRDEDDYLSRRFAQSLELWKNDPNR